MNGTTLDDLHGRLVRDTFGRRLNDQDAFLLFFLFHNYRLVLADLVLTDRPDVREVAALTQRGAAQALASAWAGTPDERAEYTFWYHRWNGEWKAGTEALSCEQEQRLEQLRAELERHPFVIRLEPED